MFAAGWCGGIGAGGWLLMAGLWAGFLAVVVWAVLWLFPHGRTSPGGPRPGPREPAADLDRRLAAGEISADDCLRQQGEPAHPR